MSRNFFYYFLYNLLSASSAQAATSLPLHFDLGLVAVVNVYAGELFAITVMYFGSFINLRTFFILLSIAVGYKALTLIGPLRNIIRILLFFL